MLRWLLTYSLLALGFSFMPTAQSRRQGSPTPLENSTSAPSALDVYTGNGNVGNTAVVVSVVATALTAILTLGVKLVKYTFDFLIRRKAQEERALRRAAAASAPPSPPAAMHESHPHITVNVSPPHSRRHSSHHIDLELGLKPVAVTE